VTTTQTRLIAPPVTAPTATAASIPTAALPATTTRATAPVTQTTQSAAPPVKEDPGKRFPAHPDKAYIELTYPDVAWLHGQGVLTLDARRTSVYEQGHIAGARPMPVWESDVDDRVNRLFNERSDPQSQALPIVIYCSGGDCEDSHMLAQKLWGIQFNNVYVYKDGFPDWQKRGGAVHTGSNP
ncbi:MAG: rhodanese-like protein, partial [Acidobacteria bacterium]|nr:rhodanese-like protein [Acidobacteriota bacterium]